MSTTMTNREAPAVHTRAPVEYNLARALLSLRGEDRSQAAYEREVSDELERQFGGTKRNNSILVPPAALLETRAAVTTGGAGAGLIFERPGTVLDAIRPRSVALSFGATRLDALGFGGLGIPRQSGESAAEWVLEGESITPASGFTVERVPITSHTLISREILTRELMIQSVSSEGARSLVARAITKTLAAKVDSAALGGSGVGAEPTGIINTPGVTVVPIATNGGAPTYEHLTHLEEAVPNANVDTSGYGFAATPQVRGRLRRSESFPGAGPVWKGGQLLGYPAIASDSLPKNRTKGSGTGLHGMIFGRWEDLILAEWGPLEIFVNPYARGDEGEVIIHGFWLVGVAVQQPESFAVIVDAAP